MIVIISVSIKSKSYLKYTLRYIIICFIALISFGVMAQGSFKFDKDISQKIRFERISNLIIFPVEINGVMLSFALDTGVSKPILFNLTEKDALSLRNAETFYLHGLGADGKIEALRSKHNTFRIGNAVIENQDLYVVFDRDISFTPRLGVLVHGIIGYDIFKDYVVEVNYSSKYIRLYRPSTFKSKLSKRWAKVPLTIHKKKPYIDTEVTIKDETKRVKLLIDTGSSDALWLFEDLKNGLVPNKDLVFEDFLGMGLSGSVYGKRSKVTYFELSNFKLNDVNVAFPDSLSIDITRVYRERNGSLGGDILKRFNLFFDYKNKELHLKKNSLYNKPFTYNNSGIVLEHHGVMFVKERIKLPSTGNYNKKNSHNAVQIDFSLDYRMSLKPAYKIVEIRMSSNAYKVGLRVGDILIAINSKPAYNYELSEINDIFHGETGKTIRLRIERNGIDMPFKFKLDDAFKKIESSK